MAGITLIHQQSQLDPFFLKRIIASIEELTEVRILLHEKEFLLIEKLQQNYPVLLIDHQAYVCVIEGRIYGIDVDTNDAFKSHLLDLFDTHKKDESLKYIRNLDGEFLVYLFHKTTRKVLVVNDFLGRLPAYYKQSEQFILSRDISLLQTLTGKLSFDEQGVYEFVRVGYPLGDKTLFENLKRLPPSSYIKLDENVSLQSQSVSLQEWQESGRYVKKPEEQLYEIFKEALRNRLKGYQKPMLSLSGGLDSRIIMGEIEKEKQQVAYESFLYEHAIIQSDVKVVKELSAFYKKQVGVTSLEEWSPKYFDELIGSKYGMNYLGMAFIIPFLKSMSSNYDLMLTGDGGDKALAYLFPDIKLLGSNTAKKILRTNEVTTAKTSALLWDLNAKRNEEALQSHLNGFGFKDPRLNYKHFLLFERTKNWLFEGEDRNRQYIWSTTPFYNPEFFNLVHSINEKKKKNFQLYRAFTQLIKPELNTITNANWGFPIHHTGKLRDLLFRQHIKKIIKLMLPDVKANQHVPGEILEAVKEQLNRGFEDPLYVNKRMNFNELPQESLFHLLTLLKVAETISCK